MKTDPYNPLPLLSTLLLLLTSPPAWAEEPNPHYHRIDLTANASAEVANDTLVAVLYAQREHEQAARAAAEVNRLVTHAFAQARATNGIEAQSLDYSTTPKYTRGKDSDGNQRIAGWRVRQSIRLQSMDSQVLSRLIGHLQDGLAVERIAYILSPSKRHSLEEELITRAIAHFKRRAQLISRELEAGGYRLVHMGVERPGGTPPRRARHDIGGGARAHPGGGQPDPHHPRHRHH
ncbi:MAG: SIMPL domain-containing protein [Candidatus Sedimenticola endophacoides]